MFRPSQRLPARKPGRAAPVLAIIAGVLLIAVTVAITAVWGWRLHARRQMVYRDLSRLIRAGESFFREYGIWPSPHSGQYGDFRYGRDFPNAFVLNILRAVPGDGNAGHSVNSRRMVFLEVSDSAPG